MVDSIKVPNFYNKEILILDSTSSATIEGAKTTIDSVKRSILSGNPTKSDKMVLNIMKAMSTYLPMGIHSEGDLNHLWSIISDGVAENLSSKEIKYRSKMVYIANGDRVVHEPCPVDSINDCMLSLMSFINSNELTSLLRAIIAHFYYVYVHPCMIVMEELLGLYKLFC